MSKIPSIIRELIPVWREPQIQLPKVVRWSRWNNEGGVRTQNTLEHTHSIVLLGTIILPQLVPHGGVKDLTLLLTALLVHDHGEGELQRDVLYNNKTVKGDVEEYLAFVRRSETLPPVAWNHLHKAFLLQFALKDRADFLAFPLEAQVILEHLADEHEEDALIFTALEHFDYFLYAVEQLQDHGHEALMRHVVNNQLPHLRRFAKEIPGFAAVVWTPEIDTWAKQFLPEPALV